MLQAGETNNVTFKVNVMGTSSDPKVRVILGTSPEISFNAVQAGESWAAPLAIPSTVEAGSYDLRVEVILNSRIFVPVNKKVQIVGSSAPIQTAAPIETAAPAEVQGGIESSSSTSTPEPAPRSVLKTSMMADLNPEPVKAKEIVMPKVIAKMPEIVKKTAIAATAPKAPAALEALSTVASKPARKMYTPISSGMPKAGTVKKESIKIKISEIDAVTAKEVSKIIESKMKPVKAKIKAQGSSVVRLIKEHVFYE